MAEKLCAADASAQTGPGFAGRGSASALQGPLHTGRGVQAQARFEGVFGGERATDLRELMRAVTTSELGGLSTAPLERATEGQPS